MAIKPIFTPIPSNAFRTIWEENPNILQTDKNRLYEEYDYPNNYYLDIRQIILQTDSPFGQYRTNYQFVKTELIDCDGNITVLSDTLMREESNFNYYQYDVDPTLLDGYYYIRHSMEEDADKPIAHFRTDWFIVKETMEFNTLIEWYGGVANEIPMQWGDQTQEMRIPAHIADYAAGANVTTLEDSNNNIVNVVSNALNERFLSIDNINAYMIEKLNIAITSDRFFVNGQEFGTGEAIDIGERSADTNTYTIRIKLREKNYLIGDTEITGTLPTVRRKAVRFSTGIALRFETGKAVRFS